jgi:hypothetical protein
MKLGVTIDCGCLVLGDKPGIGVSVDIPAIAALDCPGTVGLSRGPEIMAERAGRRLDSEVRAQVRSKDSP